MIGLALIPLGLAAAAAALTLARIERVLSGDRGGVESPFTDAVSVLLAWIAFAGLVTAGLYRLGAFATLAAAAGCLAVGRLTPARAAYAPAFGWKLPLACAAMLLAVLGLFGIMSLIEGGRNG